MNAEQTELINNNIRFVHHIAKRYENSGVPKDEIVSAGYYGLVKAAKTYNPDKQTKFTTYAGICISNAMLDLIDEHAKRRARYASLDEPIYKFHRKHQNDTGGSASLIETYDDGERIEDESLQRSEIQERRLILGLYLINKSPRYAQVIRLRLRNMTHELIAKDIGISKSYISRILTRIEKELTAFKNLIDSSEGGYVKKYSAEDLAKAKRILSDHTDQAITIERSDLNIKRKAGEQ